MLSRTLFTLSCLVAANLAAKAQHVYSIRADSVRIYNVCDTAELILENHTQGVNGYLYNRGSGRTEFRKLQLANIGGNRLAILGQDTLDLAQMSGIGGIDTIYREGDSLKYVKKGLTTAVFAPRVPGLEAVLTVGNQALRNIILGNQVSDLQYYYQVNRLIRNIPYNGMFFIGDSDGKTGTSIVSRNNVPEQGKVLILDNNSNQPWYSPNNGANYYRMWHEGNLTPALIGAAPATNGAGYIHNNTTPVQTANFNISGFSKISRNGSSSFTSSYILAPITGPGGVNMQLNGDSIPGFTFWINNGTTFVPHSTFHASGAITKHGTISNFVIAASGAEITFSRNHANYIRATNSSGYLNFITGGRDLYDTASALTLYPDRRAIFRGQVQIFNEDLYIKSGGITNNASHKGIKFGTDNDDGFSAIRALRGATSNRVGLSFFTSNANPASEVMRLTDDGKLGIGTTSPTHELHVKGNVQVTGLVFTHLLSSGNSDSSLHLIGGGTNQGGQIGLFGGHRGGQIVFYTGTGVSQQPERMRITTNGSFGLGTPNPQFPVHVSTLNTEGMAIQNTGTLSSSSGAYLRLYNSGMPSAAGQRLGSVLYGANTTGTTYNVGAQIDAVTEGAWTTGSQPTSLVFYNTPVNATGVTEKMRLTSSGNLTVSGTVTATTITQTSRRELKTNIHLYPHSALEVLRGATVRAFSFKTDLSRQHIGFIADEVPREMAVPDRSGVDQGNTVGLLVKAVQELEQKNKALEDKLSELEALIREIKDKR